MEPEPPAGRLRARELGVRIGLLPAGPAASITDVPGVGVGHATIWRDEPPPPDGRGVARTGVTVIDPGGNLFRSPVPAGGAVLNGAGECTGFLAAAEWGLAETPVFLTSTMQVGRVYDAACELLMAEDPGIGADDVIIPIVAECDDSFLSECRRMQVSADDVRAALTDARRSAGPVPGGGRVTVGGPGPALAAGVVPGRAAVPAEGGVGAGTGMTCLGFKGGIGTSSRLVPSGHTVGVLVLTNFGDRERLTVDGVPVGRLLGPPERHQPPVGQLAEGQPAEGQPPRGQPPRGQPPGPVSPAGSVPPSGGRAAAGSCITVLVTDAPLDSAACVRLARRAGLGLARTGSTAHHGSGEIFLALATGLRAPRWPDGRTAAAAYRPLCGADLDPFFAAAVEATEEAVLNSLLAAVPVTGRDGHSAPALPAGQVRDLLAAAGRIR